MYKLILESSRPLPRPTQLPSQREKPNAYEAPSRPHANSLGAESTYISPKCNDHPPISSRTHSTCMGIVSNYFHHLEEEEKNKVATSGVVASIPSAELDNMSGHIPKRKMDRPYQTINTIH